MKISEAIQYLDLDDQTIIHSLTSRAGLNGDATVDQLLTAYPNNPNMTRDERLALISLEHKRPNRFASKLSFASRCEILALYRKGFKREALAAMYGLDRRTITHIYTPHSEHYKNVRQEEKAMGEVRFREKYLTPTLVEKAYTYNQENRKEESVNNRQATNKAGVHQMRGQMCDYEHRVVIQWREPDGDIEIAGWYYMDLDGDDPDRWFCGWDKSSLKTSQACYDLAFIEIMDKGKLG